MRGLTFIEDSRTASVSTADQSVFSNIDNAYEENPVSSKEPVNKAFSSLASIDGSNDQLTNGARFNSTQTNIFDRWSPEITDQLTLETDEVAERTASQQIGSYLLNLESVNRPLSVSFHHTESEEVIEDGGFSSSIPTISGTAVPFGEVGLTYTTEHGVFFSRIYADIEGVWQQSPDFLYVDKIFGSRVEIEASCGENSSGKFVVNISPMSENFMADVLVDNHLALYNDRPKTTFEENLVLIINAVDMQYESEGMVREDYLNRSMSSLSPEEEYYLSVMI